MPLHTNTLTAQDLASWEATCRLVREAAAIAARRGMTPAQFRDLAHRACIDASYGADEGDEPAKNAVG